MSSFGYSGTIAHAVLLRGGSAGEQVVLMSTAVARPLTYRRRAFPWREPPHPLLQRRLPAGASDAANATTFRSPAAGAMHVLVADHVVRARVVLPGAAYLELARAAWCALASPSSPPTGAAQLRGVFFLQPFALEASGGLHVECAVAAGGRFEVRSGDPGRSGGGNFGFDGRTCGRLFGS